MEQELFENNNCRDVIDRETRESEWSATAVPKQQSPKYEEDSRFGPVAMTVVKCISRSKNILPVEEGIFLPKGGDRFARASLAVT